MPVLRSRWPVFTLGNYQPQQFTGPAIWIRCLLAQKLPEGNWKPEQVPVVYLPGYSRSQLRDIEHCPQELQPLVELQYRGLIWSQKNGRDWTLLAFLSSKHGGLGLDMATDNVTLQALRHAARELMKEDVSRLQQQAPLKADFFQALLMPDLQRQVLTWLNSPDKQKDRLTPEQWQVFCAACRQQLQLDPDRDGPITAAQNLGLKTGPWALLWQRFKDAPNNYPNLPQLLRQAKPSAHQTNDTQLSIFESSIKEVWPQDNEYEEATLRQSLLDLAKRPADQIGTELQHLERQHGCRRRWVWAQLGKAPLAIALEHLDSLATKLHRAQPEQGTVAKMTHNYVNIGWEIDYSVIQTLTPIRTSEDLAAVNAILDILYTPWLHQVCELFQQAWILSPPQQNKKSLDPKPGLVYLFVDGLRLDVGQTLASILMEKGFQCEFQSTFASLPTVTATGKPAVTPVAAQFFGGPGLAPATAGGREVTTAVIRKTLLEAGFTVLAEDEIGDPTGCAWTECGQLDQMGHIEGWKLVHRLPEQLQLISQRVSQLLNAGWRQIKIITDHGWLLLPTTLPTHSLPKPATKVRKGRTARLKPGIQIDVPTLPWFWDQNVDFAFAPGHHCFVAGTQYEHGGLSPQETIIPQLTVTRGEAIGQIEFLDTNWRGVRLQLKLSGAAGLQAQLRTKPGDPTSALSRSRTIDAEGNISLLCSDHSLEGTAAVVVVFDPASPHRIRAQRATIIGGGETR